jgi:hypothetical protein
MRRSNCSRFAAGSEGEARATRALQPTHPKYLWTLAIEPRDRNCLRDEFLVDSPKCFRRRRT